MGAYIRKKLPQNSMMGTDRVLDMRGVEIHVGQPYLHILPSNICIDTFHKRCLYHDAPRYKIFLTTSDLCDINICLRSKVIFFINNICNHQCTHIQKSVEDTDTTFNMIHDFNWPRRHHTKIAP